MDTQLIQAAKGVRLYTAEVSNRLIPILTIQNEAGLYAGVALDARAIILAHTFGHQTEQESLCELLNQFCKVKPAP